MAVAASALLSVFLMLWSPDTGAPSTQSARSARESLTEFYGKDGADLEPYQKLLRQASIERSQGRFKEERRLYLRVLDLLNSWDASNARNLNGLTGKQTGRGKNSDRDLQKHLETLVAAPSGQAPRAVGMPPFTCQQFLRERSRRLRIISVCRYRFQY